MFLISNLVDTFTLNILFFLSVYMDLRVAVMIVMSSNFFQKLAQKS